MKSFSISEEQFAQCIGAVCADELSRSFNQHTDFLTTASWSAGTPLGADGIGLDEKKKQACATRAAAMFGLDGEVLADPAAATIADWASALKKAADQRLLHFSFVPAQRAGKGDAKSPHDADMIFQDAAAAANLLYGRRRLISLVAPHSLLGFVMTILTPNLQRIEAIDARHMTPDELSKTMAFGDVLVATPTLWRYVIREGLAAPDNAMAVSFGEPMTPELAADMRKAGFGAHREIYGSTETGVVAWRDSPADPFLLFDHWKNENGQLCRRLPRGETRAAPAMDVLEWEDEKRFRLGGRRDGAVQIGAVNVFPEQIARTICSHPAVRDCLVRVTRHGDGANRLVAHLLLDKAHPLNDRTARDIDAWCRAHLRQHERPRVYNFERVLPNEKERLG